MASVEPHTWGIWDGREINKIQVWRSPEGMVIIENPNRLGQIAFTPAQWMKVTEHVAKPEVTGFPPTDDYVQGWRDAMTEAKGGDWSQAFPEGASSQS